MVVREREPMYWIRVKDWDTKRVLYEYSSVFTDKDEAFEDVNRMVQEGGLIDIVDRDGEWGVVRPARYLVELWDTHPDTPGSKRVGSRILVR